MDVTIRALERCCLCDAYFKPKLSAAKRRQHMEACAELRGCTSAQLTERIRTAGAHVLQEARQQHRAEQAAQTLFAHMLGKPVALSPRVARLSAAIGPHCEAECVQDTPAQLQAAHARGRAVLARLCEASTTHAPPPRRRRRARMYDAAHGDTEWHRLYEAWDRLGREVQPTTHYILPRATGYVATSDSSDHESDAMGMECVPTSDGEELQDDWCRPAPTSPMSRRGPR